MPSPPPPERVWSALVAAAARARSVDAVTWLLQAGQPQVTVADAPPTPQLALCRRCLASVRPRPLRLRWASAPPVSVVRLAAQLGGGDDAPAA